MYWAVEMAECARRLVLKQYLVLLSEVSSSSHYVRSLKIFFNSFSAHINQLPLCFVLCLCVCLTRLTLLTFVYCAFDMIQLKKYTITTTVVVKTGNVYKRIISHKQTYAVSATTKIN